MFTSAPDRCWMLRLSTYFGRWPLELSGLTVLYLLLQLMTDVMRRECAKAKTSVPKLRAKRKPNATKLESAIIKQVRLTEHGQRCNTKWKLEHIPAFAGKCNEPINVGGKCDDKIKKTGSSYA